MACRLRGASIGNRPEFGEPGEYGDRGERSFARDDVGDAGGERGDSGSGPKTVGLRGERGVSGDLPADQGERGVAPVRDGGDERADLGECSVTLLPFFTRTTSPTFLTCGLWCDTLAVCTGDGRDSMGCNACWCSFCTSASRSPRDMLLTSPSVLDAVGGSNGVSRRLLVRMPVSELFSNAEGRAAVPVLRFGSGDHSHLSRSSGDAGEFGVSGEFGSRCCAPRVPTLDARGGSCSRRLLGFSGDGCSGDGDRAFCGLGQSTCPVESFSTGNMRSG